MAKAQAGDYRIISAKGSSTDPFGIDVKGGGMKDGANVQLWTPNITSAQFFTLTYRADGTARIVNRLTGKSLDIAGGSIASGTNVQMWNSNDSRAQSWDVETDGSTATYDGAAFPTYTIKCSADATLAMDVAGGAMARGANIRVWTANGTEAQRWLLVPVPAFASGGTYEIRSSLKTDMTIDVSGASDIKGANVQLWGANGSNAQKFVITEESAGEWTIRNVNSGMLLDVKAGAARSGANVQQWTDNSSRAQRWRITSYGTTTVAGTECAVVTLGSYVTQDGSTYCVDVYNSLTTASANVELDSASGDLSQRFVLYPSTPVDQTVPSPASIGWVASVGDVNRALTLPEAGRLYPSWVTTGAWATDGPNHYEWRWRTQVMDGASGTWGEWSETTEWAPVAAAIEGTDVWASDGLPATVASDCRAMQYELQVRAVAVDGEGVATVGTAATATLRAVQAAEVTMSAMGFGPEGLRISYESDYDGGTNNVSLDSIKVGGTEMLVEPLLVAGLDAEGSVLVPIDALAGWIDDGATATVTYRNGTDMYPLLPNASTHSGTVSYNTGSGMSATPIITVGAGRTIDVTVQSADVTAAWMRYDGRLTEMDVTDGTASLTPPFGSSVSYEFFLAVQSAGGDRWGVAHVSHSQSAEAMSGFKACHAWNWVGGHFLLEVRAGECLSTDYSVERNHDAFMLNEREWESIHYTRTKKGEFTAVGALSRHLDLESTREDLFDMCDQGYVTYRSPSGLVADVAVTGFRIEEGPVYTEVTVNMARVTN